MAVTAGYVCTEARRDFFAAMDAANVDLKGFSEDFYRRVCSAELAKDFNSLDAVTRIQANQIISIAGQDDLWMRIFRETGARPPVGGGCKVDTSLVGAELAESGFGYAVLLKRFAAPFLRDGRLVAPLSIEFPLAKSHYLMMPVRNQRPRPEVLILRDWLLDLDWDAP